MSENNLKGIVEDIVGLESIIKICLSNAKELVKALKRKSDLKYDAYVTYMEKLNAKRWIKRSIATYSEFANMTLFPHKHSNDIVYDIRIALSFRNKHIERLNTALEITRNPQTKEMILDEEFYLIIKRYLMPIMVNDYFTLNKYY